MIERRSQQALRNPGFGPRSFHFVYIDGNHRAPIVLSDAVLSFPLLKIGGIVIFDDYLIELNQRRVLNDTLLIWGGEFARTVYFRVISQV